MVIRNGVPSWECCWCLLPPMLHGRTFCCRCKRVDCSCSIRLALRSQHVDVLVDPAHLFFPPDIYWRCFCQVDVQSLLMEDGVSLACYVWGMLYNM